MTTFNQTFHPFTSLSLRDMSDTLSRHAWIAAALEVVLHQDVLAKIDGKTSTIELSNTTNIPLRMMEQLLAVCRSIGLIHGEESMPVLSTEDSVDLAKMSQIF